jgi:hypothetical protein
MAAAAVTPAVGGGAATTVPVFIATARPAATPVPPTPQGEAPPTITPVPGLPPAEVVMRDNVFEPANVEVPAGTLVRWVNRGANDHDVIADDLSFESPVVRPNQTYEMVFGQPGTYSYVCDLHDGMTGTIVAQ